MILAAVVVLIAVKVLTRGAYFGPVPWQFAALLMASFLTTAWLVIGIRGGRPASIPVSTLLFFVPAAGFWTFAAGRGSEPSLGAVVALVVGLYAVALVAVLIRVIRGARTSETVTLEALDRLVTRGFVWRLVITLWLTALLLEFEPVFAYVNLALNAAWEVVWIPKRTRTWAYEHVAEIAAPRQQVFDFVADPANWPRYRDDLEILDVEPPGPLRAGSRYKARSLTQGYLPGVKQRQIEMSIVVQEVVPGRSISSSDVARRHDLTVTTFDDAHGGTRLATRTSAISSFVLASQGVMFRRRFEEARLKQTLDRRIDRLKPILEASDGQ